MVRVAGRRMGGGVVHLGLALALGLVCGAGAELKIPLGFLLPFPTGDSAVPAKLAEEWTSAVRVALEVLEGKYTAFSVVPVVQNSACDYDVAKHAATALKSSGVVGVVGPACSEAARGASEVLGPAGIPIISFAATAEALGTEQYPTFFRTVFSDAHQAVSLVRVAQYFSMKTIHLMYTTELYGTSLATSVHKMATAAGLKCNRIAVLYGPNVEYGQYLDGVTISNDTIIILATTPRAAQGLWNAAADSGKLKFPWWYLGSDGATAYDLIGDPNIAKLNGKLQGEIGIAPYKGDYNPHRSRFTDFLDFWKRQTHEDFPGLLTLDVNPRFEHTRAYVTNLIDAIWSFYEAFNHILLWEGQAEVTHALVLDCLRNPDCVNYKMTTGQIAFNSSTGERSTFAQVAEYSLVNLVGLAWEEKAKLVHDADLQIETKYLARPGPIPNGASKFTVAAKATALPPGILNAVPPVNEEFLNDFGPPPLSGDVSPPPPTDTASPSTPSSSSPSSSNAPSTSSGPSTAVLVVLILLLVAALVGIALGGWYLLDRHYKRVPQQEQFVRML